MNEVKNVIGLLCKHLNYLFNLEMKPEHFRLAKFNKTDDNVIDLFWKLLNKFPKRSYTNDVIYNVKYYLKLQKYNSLPFFSLSNDRCNGSRELLIALAYLIAKDELNERVFDETKQSPINKDYEDVDVTKTNNTQYLNMINNHCKSSKDADNLLKWINGKIDYNKKLALEYDSCADKMVKKLNDSMRENYTKNEVIAIYDQTAGDNFLKKTNHIIKILENHEKWLKNSNIFWDWMNSVIKEREKSCVDLNFDNIEAFEEATKNIKCQDQI